MRLLPPRELNSKLQDQKKSSIDAGLFLAKKIDRLHEDLADAQKEHDDSIAGLKEEFKKFTAEYVENKARLEKDIRSAETKLAKLREPLDEEWSKAHELTAKNNEKSRFLTEFDAKLKTRERDALRRESQIQKAEIDAKDSLSEAQEIRKKAVEKHIKAESILATAKSYENQAKESIKIRTKEIEKREASITEREIAYKKAFEAFSIEKKALDMKKKRWNRT